MSADHSSTATPIANRGWIVTFAGLGINLALGVLYTWSVFKAKIEEGFGWDKSKLNDPYALCCLVFAFAMILAGKCQDKFGPRITATFGGLFVGAGMILTSTTQSYSVWLLGFGALVGLGLGFGYSSATPPALKWFPPSKTGLIAGLVVAGFGLASVYIAPIAAYLLGAYGVQRAMFIFGVAFIVIVCGLAQLLINPPAGYVAGGASLGTAAKPATIDAKPSEMIKTPEFWLMWLTYFIGSGAGLMVIGSVSSMAKKSMGSSAFMAVALLAIGNAGGRIAAGFVSDKIGRKATLMLVLLLQAVLMFIAIPVTGAKEGSAVMIVVLAMFIGANYGANLSLFPSFAKDFWGLKNFGTNYGVLFTAWGVGGLVLPIIQQNLYASSKSYQSSLVAAGSLLIVAVTLTDMIGNMNRSKLSKPITIIAAGIVAAFFMPWVQFHGLGLSGYHLGQLGAYINWAWVVLILAGVTIALGFLEVRQRPIGILAGLAPIGGLLYGLAEVGRDLFQTLSIGSYLTLFLSVAIIIASLLSKPDSPTTT